MFFKKNNESEKLLEMVRSGQAAALDVRELSERKQRDLDLPTRSHHLPLSQMTEASFKKFLGSLGGKDKVVVYCAAGGRSKRVVNHFSALAKESGVELLNLPGGVARNA